MIGATDDDLKLLLAKSFLLAFDSGVVVVKHWYIHNTVQKDRTKPTVYREERARLRLKENKAYTFSDTSCIQNGNSLETQIRLDQIRLDQNSNSNINTNIDIKGTKTEREAVALYNDVNGTAFCSMDEIKEVTKCNSQST